MNESGQAIGEAMRFYRLAPADVTVFHDELDLAPFKVKVKQGGGTAGHNGLRSTEAHIGPDFRRVRIGIGHPGHKDRVHTYVLGNYAKADIDTLSRSEEHTSELQSLMRISYAVLCLNNKNNTNNTK